LTEEKIKSNWQIYVVSGLLDLQNPNPSGIALIAAVRQLAESEKRDGGRGERECWATGFDRLTNHGSTWFGKLTTKAHNPCFDSRLNNSIT
jgi:hypothetical protein